ncbi:LRP2 [Mytilus coruscus]|uniref:LRP2 n=1 Tax=Mytilus coruscus TaxID=42192 RepID=A0A6J8D7C5_MYTCO|nr:LRP2 [Mytilus coruscus]
MTATEQESNKLYRWMYIVERSLGISKFRFELSEKRKIVNFTSTPVYYMKIDTDEQRLYWINFSGDMKSAKDDGSDVKTILSTNVYKNYYAIGVVTSYIYYAYHTQLFMVKKTSGSTPTVLYNDVNLIHSIFVFSSSANCKTVGFHRKSSNVFSIVRITKLLFTIIINLNEDS